MNKRVKIWFKKYGEPIIAENPDLEITGLKCNLEDGFYWISMDDSKVIGINTDEIRKIEWEML